MGILTKSPHGKPSAQHNRQLSARQPDALYRAALATGHPADGSFESLDLCTNSQGQVPGAGTSARQVGRMDRDRDR